MRCVLCGDFGVIIVRRYNSCWATSPRCVAGWCTNCEVQGMYILYDAWTYKIVGNCLVVLKYVTGDYSLLARGSNIERWDLLLCGS